MSGEAQDLLARMLTLDPEQRISLEACWAHPWVARAPRWEPPGVGAGRLYRCLTDPTTGAVLPDEAVMARLGLLGADGGAIRRALRGRECNSLTATYHLVLEAHLEAQRGAAAQRAQQQQQQQRAAAASSAADWQWDFAAIGAAAAPPAAASAANSGCIGSAGSSSLRGSGSPARPRTAAAPAGSPTRFGQEAAAAGYLSPGRAAGAAAWTPSPFSPPAFQPQRAQQQQQQQQQAAAADSERFTIKALHAAAATSPEHAHAPTTSGAAAVTAPTAQLAAAAVITSSAVATTTTVVAAADGAGPGSPCKSPRLAPLPAVLSPKQLAPVGGGRGSSGGGEYSPPAVPQVQVA